MTYRETFDDGPGGWLGWISNAEGAARLKNENSAVISESPWWIDYNHAPPGGGYLHLLFALHTHHPTGFPQQYLERGGRNGFVEGGFSRDFRNARITARLRGELHNAPPVRMLVQSKVDGLYANAVLMSQEFRVTEDWSDQSITLADESSHWLALGSRHDRQERYFDAPITDVLRDVNCDIIFVLFPLELGDVDHTRRAGEDYPVEAERLPSGYVMMDEVRIEFPE